MSEKDYYYEFTAKINKLKDFIKQMDEELKVQEKRIEEVLNNSKEEQLNEDDGKNNYFF